MSSSVARRLDGDAHRAPAITVDHVSKHFRLGQLTNLFQVFARAGARLRGREWTAAPTLKALDDVDFSVEQGEVLGIIGSNGAGKSTLLKLLANITGPTTGNVVVRGRIAPLIEVGAGLIGDLTGRENIFLNAAILGMPHHVIQQRIDQIVAFAELEEFIDTPLKRYSSGMAIRLGFSIATSVDADILIVDEVLAVGDLAFQRRCFDRMEDMIKRQGKTVIIVSHNTRQIERLCSRVIMLDRGSIVADGPPHEVCERFHEHSNAKVRAFAETAVGGRSGRLIVSDALQVLEISIVDACGVSVESIPYLSDFTIRVRLRLAEPLSHPTFGFGIHTADFLNLATHNSEDELSIESMPKGAYVVSCAIRKCRLVPGVYSLRLGITEGLAALDAFYGENLLHFRVDPSGAVRLPMVNRQGFFTLDATWKSPEALDG